LLTNLYGNLFFCILHLNDSKILSKLPGINCKESNKIILVSKCFIDKDRIALSFQTGIKVISLLLTKDLIIKIE